MSIVCGTLLVLCFLTKEYDIPSKFGWTQNPNKIIDHEFQKLIILLVFKELLAILDSFYSSIGIRF